jgi:hypothetical protein
MLVLLLLQALGLTLDRSERVQPVPGKDSAQVRVYDRVLSEAVLDALERESEHYVELGYANQLDHNKYPTYWYSPEERKPVTVAEHAVDLLRTVTRLATLTPGRRLLVQSIGFRADQRARISPPTLTKTRGWPRNRQSCAFLHTPLCCTCSHMAAQQCFGTKLSSAIRVSAGPQRFLGRHG